MPDHYMDVIEKANQFDLKDLAEKILNFGV